MTARRKILNDLSKVANSAAGVVQGAYSEAETVFRQRLEALLDRMDLVTREEFNAVKAMAEKARRENTALAKRIVMLEGKPAKTTAKKKPAPKKTVTKKTATKKPTAKKATTKKPAAKKPTAKKATAKKASVKKKS